MQLLRAAIARGANIEELDRLIALKERMDADEARKAFVAAMVAFKRNAPTIYTNQTGEVLPKDGKRGFTYGYADLAEVNDKIIAALASVDISHDWSQRQDSGLVYVKCTLTHVLGHSKSTELGAGPDNSGGKTGPQAIGSTNTYLERYTLLAVCGLAVRDGSDNDAAGAMVTPAEREEMRTAARELRQGQHRQRPSAAQLASRKQEPASDELLTAARAAADKGHKEFGTYWRQLPDNLRGQLLGDLDSLTERANAASQQQEPK